MLRGKRKFSCKMGSIDESDAGFATSHVKTRPHLKLYDATKQQSQPSSASVDHHFPARVANIGKCIPQFR